MRAMVLRRAGEKLVLEERPEPQPGPGEVETAGRGLRRLPHRSACRRRRVAEPQAADRAGARDRRQGRGGRRRRDARYWRAGRRALARPHLRPLPLLRQRPRESVRRAAVQRLHARRRLRQPCRRRRRLRLSARQFARPRRRRAAALRRADRLALAEGGGRGGTWSASTALAPRRILSRSFAAGRGGASSPSPATATSPPKNSRCRWTRNGRAVRAKRRRSRWTRRSSSLRSALWSRPRWRRSRRAGAWSAAAFT